MADLIYFSNVSGNTRRFVERLGRPAARIPLRARDAALRAEEPYVLVTPTYAAGRGRTGAVPRQVIRFLNDPHNRSLIRGVIASGNSNFGESYGIAGDIVAAKCRVPYLYRFELMGLPEDLRAVDQGLDAFWQQRRTRRHTPTR